MIMVLHLGALILTALISPSQANMLDLLQPLKLRPSECTLGCANWADLAGSGSSANQAAVDAAWAAGAPPAGAGNHCAQQGRGLGATAGANYTDGWNNSSPWGPDMALPGAYGAFCYCANNSGWGHCQSPRRTPEQINVQLSGPTSVVVAFVTFGDVDVRDGGAPPPVAQFWPAGGIPSKGKIQRVGPDFGSTLTVSNRDSQSNCWVNWNILGQPCEFQVPAPAAGTLWLASARHTIRMHCARLLPLNLSHAYSS
jgi:hypothetical protein